MFAQKHTLNTNALFKFVFFAVVFGFLFQLREIAAEYQCPSFGALFFLPSKTRVYARCSPPTREDGLVLDEPICRNGVKC